MSQQLQTDVLRLSRWHFAYVAALAAQIIIFDAWQLLAPTAVLQRWVATILLLCAVTGIWYLAHPGRAATTYRHLIFGLILADVAMASFAVYNQRGMAARAVALFAVPLAVATVVRNRTALFATAALCVAGYVLATVAYFVLHFNEGYKIELYGEVGLYAALFVVLAGLLSVASGSPKS